MARHLLEEPKKDETEQVGHFALTSWPKERANMLSVYGLHYLKPAGRGEHLWEATNGEIWRI